MTKQIPVSELAKRLKSLPSPAGNLFSRLYKQGLMTNAVARTLIGAAEVAGTPRQVMGFATALHALRARRVPVTETIRLAQRLGRQINLLGSVKHWNEQYGRLRRLAELREATEANEAYDTTGVEALLPARWPGYLIRTSRRLALVCFRLRIEMLYNFHVANQTDGAYAVVFGNGERWIVYLVIDRTEETPQLRIRQIRGEGRRLPLKEARDAIYERLGLTPRSLAYPVVPGHQVDAEIEPLYKANLRHLLTEFAKHDVARVTLTESTNYQNRASERVVVVNSAGEDISKIVLPAPVLVEMERARRVDDGWVPQRRPRKTHIDLAISWLASAIAESAVQDNGEEWRSRRNGSRTMVIDVTRGTVTLTAKNRKTGSPAFHRHIDIETGQEVEPASQEAA